MSAINVFLEQMKALMNDVRGLPQKRSYLVMNVNEIHKPRLANGRNDSQVASITQFMNITVQKRTGLYSLSPLCTTEDMSKTWISLFQQMLTVGKKKQNPKTYGKAFRCSQ